MHLKYKRSRLYGLTCVQIAYYMCHYWKRDGPALKLLVCVCYSALCAINDRRFGIQVLALWFDYCN